MKNKYSNEKKLSLREDENTSALINIGLEGDSSIFELLENSSINYLKML